MGHIRTPDADSDLDEIWYYVARTGGNADVADRLIDAITERFHLLARHPYSGRARDEDLLPGLRSFPAGEHIIIYRVQDGDAVILRVFTPGGIPHRFSGSEQQHGQSDEVLR